MKRNNTTDRNNYVLRMSVCKISKPIPVAGCLSGGSATAVPSGTGKSGQNSRPFLFPTDIKSTFVTRSLFLTFNLVSFRGECG